MIFMEKQGLEQEYARAQLSLGAMYADGVDVPKDFVKAYCWYNLAASMLQYDEMSAVEARERRESLAEQMTPEQIAEAQRCSSSFKPKKHADK